MNQTRYVQILCRVCGGKTLTVGGMPRPRECGLCKAPWDEAPEEEQEPAPGSARPTDTGVRRPTAFPRGTFTNTSAASLKKSDTASGRAPAVARKASGVAPAPGGLKDKLKRLFNPRS